MKFFDLPLGEAEKILGEKLTDYNSDLDVIKFVRNKTILEIDQKIVEQMNKYANTPLGERDNSFNELYKLRQELDKLK